MRTSLNNIKTADDYLLGNMASEEALLFEAKMLLDNELMDDVKHQQNTHAMISAYSRQQIKAEIIAAVEILATAPQYRSLMQRVTGFFKGL